MKVYIVNEITVHDYDYYGTTSIGAFSSMEKACSAIENQINTTYNDESPSIDWVLHEDNNREYLGYVWVCDDESFITKYDIWKVEFDEPLWQS